MFRNRVHRNLPSAGRRPTRRRMGKACEIFGIRARSIKERTEPADALHLGTVRPFYFLAGLFGLRVRLLGHGQRVPPYEVVDREKNDRTDERTNKACRLACVIQT
jgi:hypothetical protein